MTEYCFEELNRATYWWMKAAEQNYAYAQENLGMLCRDTSLSDAARYWRAGAERGNEDCRRMLENPDFIDITVAP